MVASGTSVVVGRYHYNRNPMYVAVTLALLGWAVSLALPGLYVYAVVVAVAFQLRVVLGEEPWLARTHGLNGKNMLVGSTLVLVSLVHAPNPLT